MDGAVHIVTSGETRRGGYVTAPAPDDCGDGAAGHILAIAASRDRAAFTVLFARFAPRIKTFLMRRGAPDGLAEELAQETLLSVWRKAEAFDPARGTAEAWIFTIARNVAIDAARRRAGLVSVVLDMALEESEPPRGEAAAFAAQAAVRLRAAVLTLPRDQIEVVRMAFFEGCTHSEIAQALRLPIGTVKSRLRLAIRRLSGLVEDLR